MHHVVCKTVDKELLGVLKQYFRSITKLLAIGGLGGCLEQKYVDSSSHAFDKHLTI